MKKIIVPVDFSATSVNAAEFAGNLAIFYGAELWLYHAYEMPVGVGEISWPLYNVQELQQAATTEIDNLRQQIQSRLRSKITIHTKAEMAPLVDGIDDLCKEVQPDLVVMGLSGKDALTKLVVGSNTIRVIQHIKYPVLVIPTKATFTPVLRIGFAYDYQKMEASTPVALVKKVVKDFNAECYVLNVDYQDANFDINVVDESFRIRNLFRDLNPVYDSIESEDVTQGLNKYADEKRLDWLVVIPKKHTLLQKIFNRSHSQDLLYHTHLPILCIHE